MIDNLTEDDSYKKMISDQPYFESPVITAQRDFIRERLQDANGTPDPKERSIKISKLMGKVGKNFRVETDFRISIGQNIQVGENFYANYDVTICDEAPVIIGNNCKFGPKVALYTPYHPLNGEMRATKVERSKAIVMGDNTWIGGGAMLLPGVHLGDNVVVGAGSVVTKSFPDNVVVAGNPARVIREITEDTTW